MHEMNGTGTKRRRRRLSQHEIIVLHLTEIGQWIPSHALRSVQTVWGWIGHQGDRRARELAERGELLRRRNDDSGFAEYRIADLNPGL